MEGHSPDVGWQEQRALIIGRAYPEPSKRHIETVCTGAITEDGKVLRLYPISLRYLDDTQQYKLWSWARFRIKKSADDHRKESYRVQENSISVISHVDSAAEQFTLLSKAIVSDRETLEEMYHEDWTSIGVVEIDLVRIEATAAKADWSTTKPYTRQSRLDVEVKPLEQPPFELRIWFRCKNNAGCKGHESNLIGWEYMEAFRNFRERYGSESAAIDKIKEALAQRFSDSQKSAYALLGTHSRHPIWMVAQLYFFRKDLQPLMF